MSRISVLLVASTLVVSACSGSSDDGAPSSTEPSEPTTPAVESERPGDGSDGASTTDDGDATTGTREVNRPDVVPLEGSVQALILTLPDATNFAAGVRGWLEAVPGQEGVLRNSRGITVFVPADEGFPEDARDEAFADPETAAFTIGGHLHVGGLEQLEGTVVVATGGEHVVGAGGETIGGRRVLRSETGTNGIVYVIDGPLTADAGVGVGP